MRRSLPTITPRDAINLIRPLYVYENLSDLLYKQEQQKHKLGTKGG
jgi:hypothetical protein